MYIILLTLGIIITPIDTNNVIQNDTNNINLYELELDTLNYEYDILNLDYIEDLALKDNND